MGTSAVFLRPEVTLTESNALMNPPAPSRWLHRFAWLIAALTLLLPVTTGAVVTTLKAGMVFSDWPSSDGYNMLAYPWLSSARDQFVEHGHRLAGMVIGLLSLSLIVAAWLLDQRRSVRMVAVLIFLAVFSQGMLGGARVLMDEQTLALLHGDFAALVFSLMATLVLITSKGWDQRERLNSATESRRVSVAASLLLGCLVLQYVMGGFLRHLREREAFAWSWLVHPWFALVVLAATGMFIWSVIGTHSRYLNRFAVAMVVLTLFQSLVGLGAWYVRYGVPAWGVVAQQDSLPQIVICSLHKVIGLLTLMTSVLAVICCRSLRPLGGEPCNKEPINQDRQATVQPLGKSVAGAAT